MSFSLIDFVERAEALPELARLHKSVGMIHTLPPDWVVYLPYATVALLVCAAALSWACAGLSGRKGFTLGVLAGCLGLAAVAGFIITLYVIGGPNIIYYEAGEIYVGIQEGPVIAAIASLLVLWAAADKHF